MFGGAFEHMFTKLIFLLTPFGIYECIFAENGTSYSIKREIILDKITVQLSYKVKPHSTLKMFIRYFVAFCAVAFCAVAINADVEAEKAVDTEERANPVSICACLTLIAKYCLKYF